MWINPIDKKTFRFHHEIREAFPNVSFLDNIDEGAIEFIGLMPVVETPKPEHDPETESVIEGDPVQIDGQWHQTWEVVPREPEPEYVPEEVEGWQAEVAMRATLVDPEDVESQNVWDRVQDIIAAMPDGMEKITAQTVLARGKIRRDSPMLAQLAPLVPLSEQRVDDMFRLAGSIEA